MCSEGLCRQEAPALLTSHSKHSYLCWGHPVPCQLTGWDPASESCRPLLAHCLWVLRQQLLRLHCWTTGGLQSSEIAVAAHAKLLSPPKAASAQRVPQSPLADAVAGCP